MKAKSIILVLFILVLPISSFSSQRGKAITSRKKSGSYVESDIVTAEKLKWLPVPIATGSYAFYQSIHMISNVVIGDFNIGNPEIILIQDINADEKVDVVVHLFTDSGKLSLEDNPNRFCPKETFRKLKDIIVTGKSETVKLGRYDHTITPNKAGITEYEKLVKNPSNIRKYKQGLRIISLDPDERSNEMLSFSYSFNSADDTVDLAFNVKYFYMGSSRISPLINFGVYCSKSIDPFAKEKVKEIREITLKYID